MQTRPNATLISEEVEAKHLSLSQVTHSLVSMIVERAKQGAWGCLFVYGYAFILFFFPPSLPPLHISFIYFIILSFFLPSLSLLLPPLCVGKHYGVILLPEGIIEFIPEFQALMHELNDLMAAGVANNEEVGREGGREDGREGRVNNKKDDYVTQLQKVSSFLNSLPSSLPSLSRR